MIPNLNFVKSIVLLKWQVHTYLQNTRGHAKISKLVLYAVNVFGQTNQIFTTIIFVIIFDTVICSAINLNTTFYTPAINSTPAIILHH